jgi:hypothetical protein
MLFPCRGEHMKTACFFLLLTLPVVVHAQWEPDRKLSTNEVSAALNENMGHCVVADGCSVHAVWCDTDNDGSAIYYKRSDDGGVTWGPDIRISGHPGSDSFPLLAVSGSTVHLVFLRDNGTAQSASYYKRSTDGGDTWGPDVLLGNTKWWPGVAAAGSMVYVSLNGSLAADNSEVFFRRSTDNGTSWEPEQQISNAVGRSEDPAIAADGPYVYLVWNDDRDNLGGGGMAVYYRRSPDMGMTWGPETALTRAPEFTYFPTIYPSGPDVDVSYGDRQTGFYDIYYLHSADFGSTWGERQQMTQTPVNELYPAIAREGSELHLLWTETMVRYRHSGDGGTTWDPMVPLVGQGCFPFVAVQGGTVHVIFLSERDGHKAIYYKRYAGGAALFRNSEWPGLALPAIFTGPGGGCPAAGPPGISLDPWGADCIAGSGDDDTYIRPFAAGTSDPDGSILSELTRPLVFYQYLPHQGASAGNTLALTKDGSGGLRIDCR